MYQTRPTTRAPQRRASVIAFADVSNACMMNDRHVFRQATQLSACMRFTTDKQAYRVVDRGGQAIAKPWVGCLIGGAHTDRKTTPGSSSPVGCMHVKQNWHKPECSTLDRVRSCNLYSVAGSAGSGNAPEGHTYVCVCRPSLCVYPAEGPWLWHQSCPAMQHRQPPTPSQQLHKVDGALKAAVGCAPPHVYCQCLSVPQGALTREHSPLKKTCCRGEEGGMHACLPACLPVSQSSPPNLVGVVGCSKQTTNNQLINALTANT